VLAGGLLDALDFRSRAFAAEGVNEVADAGGR
jgi:hypothetical protein